MPKYTCSYAHDIACFADFVVTARNEKAALRIIRKALREGKFKNVDASPCWENGSTNERVFVQGRASLPSLEMTLTELIGEPPVQRPPASRPARRRRETKTRRSLKSP